ncbi:MAG: peroxiredoxin [Rhodospirillaceae bacterium]
MTIQVGDRIPEVTLGIMTENGPDVTHSKDLFAGKRVAMFGVPGAFTRTCSMKHLPGFVNNADALKAMGVDTIICLSVIDPWVMDAWGKAQNVGDKVTMIGDGALNFTRAAGLEVDLNAKCYGPRCKRFSMLVDDGVVTTLHFEDGGFGETSAEKLLKDLG